MRENPSFEFWWGKGNFPIGFLSSVILYQFNSEVSGTLPCFFHNISLWEQPWCSVAHWFPFQTPPGWLEGEHSQLASTGAEVLWESAPNSAAKVDFVPGWGRGWLTAPSQISQAKPRALLALLHYCCIILTALLAHIDKSWRWGRGGMREGEMEIKQMGSSGSREGLGSCSRCLDILPMPWEHHRAWLGQGRSEIPTPEPPRQVEQPHVKNEAHFSGKILRGLIKRQ